MAGTTGLEPAAFRVTGRHPNYLSEARAYVQRIAGLADPDAIVVSSVTGQRSNQLNYVPNCFLTFIGNPRV